MKRKPYHVTISVKQHAVYAVVAVNGKAAKKLALSSNARLVDLECISEVIKTKEVKP